jgi:hypothetical protein
MRPVMSATVGATIIQVTAIYQAAFIENGMPSSGVDRSRPISGIISTTSPCEEAYIAAFNSTRNS